MKETKRFLALVLSLSMTLMPMPVQVFAAGDDAPAAAASAEAAPGAEPTEPPTDAPYTDALAEIPVGCTLTLYDYPAEMYDSVSVFPENAEIIREEGCPYLKLHALHEGIVTVRASNAPAWYDHMFWGGDNDRYFNIVAGTEDTQTRTEHSGFWVKNGETRRLGFWNPADMQAEDAEFDVLYGADRVEVTYDKGSDWLNITGKSDGIAVIEVREKRTKKAVRVRIMVSDEKPTEQPMYTDDEPLTEPATQPQTQVTDPFEPPATTTTVIESTEFPTTFETIATSTTAAYTTTVPWTYVCGADTVLKYDNDTVAVDGKLEIQVRYQHLDGSWIPQDLRIKGYDPYLSWKYDATTGILTVYGKQAGTAELEIQAKGAQESARMTLHISDADSTAAPSTSTVTTTTLRSTTTTVIRDYAPQVTYDKKTMAVGETRRIHVEHPEYGKAEKVSVSYSHGTQDKPLIFYMFDPETSDLYLTAAEPFENMTFSISAAGCAFNAYITLTAVVSETTGVALSTTTFPATTTTTTTTTMTETHPDFAPQVSCDKTDLRIGEVVRVHVKNPMTGKGFTEASLSCAEEGLVEWEFDKKTSDILVTALRPFHDQSFSISAPGCAFIAHFSLSAHYPQTDVYHSETAATTTTITTTTAKATETAETHPVSAPQTIEFEYDDSPMQPGEVRAVRFREKADPDKILQSFSYKQQSEDFRTHHDAGTNTIYVTALTAGEVKLAFFYGAEAAPVTVSIPIGEASDKHVQKLGYITDDDLVNAGDAADILRESARIGANAEHLLTGLKCGAADVNFDGLVNSKDANAILVYAAYKGTHADAPDFPGYIAMQYAKPRPENFRQLTYLGDYPYINLPDDGTWTAGETEQYPKFKYRVISSDEEFAALAEYLNDTVALGSEVKYCKEHKVFDTQAMIAIITDEPVTGYRYQLADVSKYDRLNAWTVDLICRQPVQGGAVMSSQLILIDVDKSAAFADKISIKMTCAAYDPAFFVPFTAYTNLNGLTYMNEDPVIITSQEQLAEVFGDDLNKARWLKMGDASENASHTAAEASNNGDETFFQYHSLICLSQLETRSGFFDLHISDVAFDKNTGELTVTGVRVDSPTDVMGYEYWRILVDIDKEIADQVKTVKFRYGEPLESAPAVTADPSVLRRTWAVRQQVSSMPEFKKLYTSIEELEADYPQGLKDETDTDYDGDFFKNHALIVLGRALPSGSIMTSITGVTEQDGVYNVTVQEKVPTICTADMAYWQLFAEVGKSDTETCSLNVDVQTIHPDEQ